MNKLLYKTFSCKKRDKPFVSILKSILGFVTIYILSAIIAEVCIIIVFMSIGMNIISNDIPDNILTQTMPLFGFIFFAIGAMLYCRFAEKRSLHSMGFVKEKFILNYLKGLFIGLILILSVLFISLVTGILTYNGFNDQVNVLSLILFFIGYAIQGMAEEVMCRGYLMTSLCKRTSLYLAVLINSFLFVIPHLSSLLEGGFIVTVMGFINTMFFSIFVSLYMIKTKNIWVISGIHSAWNFLLGVLCGINLSGKKATASLFIFAVTETKDFIHGGIYGLEAGIVTTLILIISISLLLISMKKTSTKSSYVSSS